MAHILIVDDETDVRELFNITAKMAGHVTNTAADGLEALNQLEKQRPDLVLLDLMMPRLDGFGFLARVRSEMAEEPLRVLVATAKVLDDDDRINLKTWPVVGILNKGDLDVGQMMMLVRQALTKDPVKPSPQPPAAVQPAPEATSAPTAAKSLTEKPATPPTPTAAPSAAKPPEADRADGKPAGAKPGDGKADGAAPETKKSPSEKDDEPPRKRRMFL